MSPNDRKRAPATGAASARRSRALVIALAVALLGHLGLILWGASGPLNAPSRPEYDIGDFAIVIVGSLGAFGAILGWRPRHNRIIAMLAGPLVAAIMLGPSVVLLVGLMLLNARVVGERVLGWAVRGDDTDPAKIAPGVDILVGLSVWIGVMSVTASLKIHHPPVYAIALLAPLVIGWRRTLPTLGLLRVALARPSAPFSSTERGWIALLLTVVVVHLFIVAKPDVGNDANAVHLQFAALFVEHYRWVFDVTRYAWAVMPLGADYAFAAAYMMGGEQAARLLNLCFGAIACWIAYQLMTRYARREVALLSVTLFASMPLAFLETGTLFVENLWTAFLLAALLLALDYERSRSASVLTAIALLGAGAMQTKVIGAIWLAPVVLYVGFIYWRRTGGRPAGARSAATLLIAAIFAAWPYANALVRTGNPVFPFMNDVFHSPLFDATKGFGNPLYVVSPRPWSIYDLFLASGRFIEGTDGAAGFHWLLLLPLIVFAFLHRRPRAQWLCLALAAIFYVAVFSQQAYLRYLIPALALIAALGAWAINDLPWTRGTRLALLVVGGALGLLNLRLIPAASWPNVTLCLTCAWDRQARTEYVATYLPDREVAAYLNSALPDARVGFFTLNAPGACGYVGYSRAANWHDIATYEPLLAAESADDVLAIAHRFQLTHAVFLEAFADVEHPPIPAIGVFRDNYTQPIWHYRGRVVAAIGPEVR